MEPCRESSRSIDITDDDGLRDGSCGTWSGGGSTCSWSNDIADGGPSGIARISLLNQWKGGLRVAPFLVILLSAEDLSCMVRVVNPINAVVNVVELVEMAPNLLSRLVDLLVGIGVGVAWHFIRVDNMVSSQPPLKIGAASLEMASTWTIRANLP